jgi:MFS family permease
MRRFVFVSGYAADRYGLRLLSMTVWSIICGLAAAAVTNLVVPRVIFILGEGTFHDDGEVHRQLVSESGVSALPMPVRR